MGRTVEIVTHWLLKWHWIRARNERDNHKTKSAMWYYPLIMINWRSITVISSCHLDYVYVLPVAGRTRRCAAKATIIDVRSRWIMRTWSEHQFWSNLNDVPSLSFFFSSSILDKLDRCNNSCSIYILLRSNLSGVLQFAQAPLYYWRHFFQFQVCSSRDYVLISFLVDCFHFDSNLFKC
jgi:hypothetical protein